ncbi:DUF6377 domain-containing protein [Parabacteroides sp. OttesenSCG-928-G21]|nr:DUF6377 domain-containing protein [Parabacteroides sp. OttesenSCG-928-G21]
MAYKILLVITALLNYSAIQANSVNKYEAYFQPLDTAILQHAEYVQTLETQIQDLRLQRSRISEISELYLLNKLLFSKFQPYISDSALFYLEENEKISLQANKAEWLNETYLDKCNIYIKTGMLSAATDEFEKIKIDDMPGAFKARYYSLRVYLLEQERELTGSSDRQKILEYGRELMKYATINEESYIWGLLWSYQGEDKNLKLIEYLEKEYEKNARLNNPRAGNNALVLSRIYRNMGEEDLQMRYLCLGALWDVKHVNRDPSALLELVSYLSQIGDSRRAYVYLNYILDGQSFYPDRVRASQMAQYMKRIFEETQLVNEHERQKTTTYLYWLSFGIILLILLFIVLGYVMYKLYQQKKNITEINTRLNENIAELSRTQNELILSNRKMQEATEEILKTNKQLKEANYIKEEYIGYIFSTCSNYINKLDEFRQTVNRKIKAGQVEETIRLTQPTNSFMHDEIKELNQTFDSIFLSIYPDFVDDFNLLLRKEERFVIPENEGLNTELRIFALVWLGINSSSKIANLLHLSPQTVYNARMKIKNKAIADNEKFAEIVRALGREKIGV